MMLLNRFMTSIWIRYTWWMSNCTPRNWLMFVPLAWTSKRKQTMEKRQKKATTAGGSTVLLVAGRTMLVHTVSQDHCLTNGNNIDLGNTVFLRDNLQEVVKLGFEKNQGSECEKFTHVCDWTTKYEPPVACEPFANMYGTVPYQLFPAFIVHFPCRHRKDMGLFAVGSTAAHEAQTHFHLHELQDGDDISFSSHRHRQIWSLQLSIDWVAYKATEIPAYDCVGGLSWGSQLQTFLGSTKFCILLQQWPEALLQCK